MARWIGQSRTRLPRRALAATASSHDLAPVDEFHIGGRQATIDFAEQLHIEPGKRLLDIGCGLGGASRYFALA